MPTCYILNDTRSEKHHGCEIVMRHLFQALQDRQIQILGALPLGEKISPISAQHFKQADLIIINGEGTFHHSAHYAQYLLECGVQAKQNNQKVFLINSTWEENSEEMLNQVATFDGIWLRDKKSLTIVKQCAAHAQYAPDLTFAYPYNIADTESSTSVTLTDSVYSHISDVMADYAHQNQCFYAPIIHPLPIQPNHIGYDAKKLKKARLYNFISWISFNLFKPRRYYQDLKFAEVSTEKYWYTLKYSQALITARYHALCFAIQLDSPFLAIKSNTHKVENLLNDIGLDTEKRIIDWKNMHSYSTTELIELAQWSNEEQQKLSSFKHHAQQSISNMFDQIQVSTEAY